MELIKTFGLPIIMFIAMGYATLSHACEGEPLYPETVTISINFVP